MNIVHHQKLEQFWASCHLALVLQVRPLATKALTSSLLAACSSASRLGYAKETNEFPICMCLKKCMRCPIRHWVFATVEKSWFMKFWLGFSSLLIFEKFDSGTRANLRWLHRSYGGLLSVLMFYLESNTWCNGGSAMMDPVSWQFQCRQRASLREVLSFTLQVFWLFWEFWHMFGGQCT